MKEMRIMKAIGDIDDKYIEEAETLQSSKIRMSSHGKYAALAACGLLVIGIGIISFNRKNDISVTEPTQSETVVSSVSETIYTPMEEAVSPFMDFNTLEEAEKAVGFDIAVPDSFDDYTEKSCTVISGEMLQIQYRNSSDELGLIIRKSYGSDDISGDYNTYEQISEIIVSDRKITIKGNGNKYQLAIWQDGGFSYAVSFNSGISEEELTDILEKIK